MIDTVVWDFGNVLIPWDVRWALRQDFVDEAALEAFLVEIDFFAWHAQQDAGRSVAEGVAELSARFPQHASPIAAVYARWLDTMGPAIAGSVALLRELNGAGVRCLGLSNFSAELFALSRPRYNFLDMLDGIVLSGEEGVNKPDPRIYEVLFARHGVNPARAVFIDDSLPNVEASQALGMRAIHFVGRDAAVAPARAALRALGLPV